MKKIKVLFIVLMVLSLVGCNKKEEEEQIVGGFTEAQDSTITSELQEIFDLALQDYDGMSFKPKELVSTQVVAGINYKFLCEGSAVVPNAESSEYYVTVYKDLSGNCKIINVEKIEK